mgnify:CR=1 FL=1
MANEKQCPTCGAEYRADIEVCVDCNTSLIQDASGSTDETNQFPEDATLISVAMGSVKNIQPLVKLLEENDLKFRIDLSKHITEGMSPNSDFHLMLDEKDVPRFNQLIEEYKYKEFPELSAADELMEAGCCPACGTKVGDETVCPECELPLVIIEETDED